MARARVEVTAEILADVRRSSVHGAAVKHRVSVKGLVLALRRRGIDPSRDGRTVRFLRVIEDQDTLVSWLAAHGPASIKEIMDYMAVPHTTAVRWCWDLVDQRRVDIEKDGRAWRVSVASPAGTTGAGVPDGGPRRR